MIIREMVEARKQRIENRLQNAVRYNPTGQPVMAANVKVVGQQAAPAVAQPQGVPVASAVVASAYPNMDAKGDTGM